MLAHWIRKILFQLDAERAHHIGQKLIRLRYAKYLPTCFNANKAKMPTTVFGLPFSNPIGLAAGWDKNGACIDALFRLGFGFVEVGTVTPKPQSGNPKPRLFRIPQKQALINRMGFNNDGVEALAQRIVTLQEPGILGINIGKNFNTPLDNALDDYQYCLEQLYPFADYFVVNISSPNTPGLRELQSKKYLSNLLSGIDETRKTLQKEYDIPRPILVKTTVDLDQNEYDGFLQAMFDANIDGLIISNTTIDHSSVQGLHHGNEKGGVSGAPLRTRVSQMIAEMQKRSGGKLPIVGVGGILTGEDAKAHWQAGASLLQLYTGFVYRGPALIQACINQRSTLSEK